MKVYEPQLSGYPLTRQDLTWLQYVPQHYLELQIEAGDELEYSVFMDACAKKCGLNLIYEDDEKDYLSNDQAMIQYASSSYQDVILDKDVSADQAVADNKGKESVTTATSPSATRGTSGKRKRDDSNKSGGCQRKIPSVLPFFNDVTTQVADNDTSDDSDKIS